MKTMPESLTAENGAKKLLIGEFSVTITVVCTACHFHGGQDDCEMCGGAGTYNQNRDVDWPTIKAIYAKAYAHYDSTSGSFNRESSANPIEPRIADHGVTQPVAPEVSE